MSQTALLSQMESRIVCEADVSPVVSSEILSWRIRVQIHSN